MKQERVSKYRRGNQYSYSGWRRNDDEYFHRVFGPAQKYYGQWRWGINEDDDWIHRETI